MRLIIIALLGASALATLEAAATPCTGRGVELQVLGSGGPELEDKRASSSYFVWQDGRPRILVDSGGGSSLRFGQAGAHVAQHAPPTCATGVLCACDFSCRLVTAAATGFDFPVATVDPGA